MKKYPIALVDDFRSPIVDTEHVSFDELANSFAHPEIGTKDGYGLVFADIDEGSRNGERVRTISFLALDVEAKAEAVKDDEGESRRDKYGDIIKQVIGIEPPLVDEMMAELAVWGWHCILHTTYSHGGSILPAGVVHPRYRLIFELARPVMPADLKLFGVHVAVLLGISDCTDLPCLDAARMFNLPRVPDEVRKQLYRCEVSEGEPLDVDAMLTEARQIEAAKRPLGKERSASGSVSVIDAFNAQANIGKILEEHGYIPKDRGRWLLAGSTTGLPGVRLLPDKGDGEHVYSSHGGDPLNDGHAHDAFDCFRILEHGGDMTAAVKAAAVMLGMKLDSGQGKQSSSKASQQGGGTTGIVTLICASDVTPVPICWLWVGWLAAGKLHVFGGAPGTGKTTVSMGVAATVSIGGRWPDGSQAEVGNVVIWSGEDDPDDTLIPRLILSGADRSRIFFIGDIREGNERRSFDPAHDMEPLRKKLEEVGDVKLLIVDPIVSAVAGDSHKNTEVRRALQPLVDLAGSMRCALLGITHFSKGTAGANPVERLTGSLAFGALARVVIVAAKRQNIDGGAGWFLCRAKSNIGPDDGGFEYDLHQDELKAYPGVLASAVMWGDPVTGSAKELLAQADITGDGDAGNNQTSAKQFLSDLLGGRTMQAADIFQEAEQRGYSERCMQRASKDLKVEKRKTAMKGGWSWTLAAKDATSP